jgi:hypothetical protein
MHLDTLKEEDEELAGYKELAATAARRPACSRTARPSPALKTHSDLRGNRPDAMRAAALGACRAALLPPAPDHRPPETASSPQGRAKPQRYSRDPSPPPTGPIPARPTAITGATVYRRRRRADRERHGRARRRQGRRRSAERTRRSRRRDRIDGAGKWVTPGIIDIHSHLGDYPSPVGRGAPGRQRSHRPGPPRSLGRAQRLAAGSGLHPRARQWRRDQPPRPARLRQPVRRPRRDAEERPAAPCSR